jgi:hypothetical protein
MAKDENKIVDRLFEGRLKEATVAPPAGLWDGIAADLENDRLRKKVAMWRWVAAATILLFLGFGSWTLVHFSSVNHNQELIALQQINPLPADQNPVRHGIASSAIEIDCPPQNPDQIAGSTTSSLSQEPLAIVKRAMAKVRKDDQRQIRKTSGIPAILTALSSRRTSPMNPSEAFSNAARRDFASIPEPVWQSVPDNTSFLTNPATNPEESDSYPIRVKRRDREIMAWNAGDKKDANKNKMKWAIGGAFSPDIAFATQIPVGNPAARSATPVLPDDPANSSRRLSDPVATFSTGLRAAVDLNDRVAVRSGLLYTRRSGSNTELASSYGKQETYANNFSVDYLELPVSIQYNVVKGKAFDYYVSTGVSGNMMLGYQQELQTSSGNITSKNVSDKSEAFSPAQASLLMSTGMQYRAFDHLSINLEPGLRYGFLTSDYAFSREDPVSFSLMSSLNFHF